MVRLSLRVVLLLTLALAGCSGRAPYCDVDDLDDVTVSTRDVQLYRLAGCPVGGR
jgi:hypothetical protein